MKFSLTNEFKDRLREEILNYNIDFIQKSFEGVSYVDITELLYEFDSNDSKYILDNIDFDKIGDDDYLIKQIYTNEIYCRNWP